MIEFDCPYCDAKIPAAGLEEGAFTPCPSCGRTAIVPATFESQVERPDKRTPKPPDMNRIRRCKELRRNLEDHKTGARKFAVRLSLKIAFAAVVCIAAFVVFFLIEPARNSDKGRFPATFEVTSMLMEDDYLSLSADGAIDIFEGRGLKRFSFAAVASPKKRALAKIDIWCDINNPNRIVAMSSLVPGKLTAPQPPDGVDASTATESMEEQAFTIHHRLVAWGLVRRISGIIESDPQFSFDANTGQREYRKNGFTLETRPDRPVRATDKKPLCDTLMILKDDTW